MTDLTEMVEWLRAEIERDKAAAEAASPGPWHANAECDEVLAADGITVCDGFALSNKQLRATVRHIVRHDPLDTIARCEAELRIIGLATFVGAAAMPPENSGRNTVITAGHYRVLGDVLRHLAYGYRFRPGYKETWTAS